MVESGLGTVSLVSLDPASASPGNEVTVMGNAENVYASATQVYVATTNWRDQGLGLLLRHRSGLPDGACVYRPAILIAHYHRYLRFRHFKPLGSPVPGSRQRAGHADWPVRHVRGRGLPPGSHHQGRANARSCRRRHTPAPAF